MKISIITISFNQVAFLRKAIDSVLSQTGIEKEYIVVDPGSTDGSRQMIQSYGNSIDRVLFEPDTGPADGLNKGFALATGDVLCFLNSDDEFVPGAFGKVITALHDRSSADFISGCGYLVDADGRRLRRIVPTRLTVADYVYGSCTVFQQGTFFRRRCFERTHGFNGENRTCWDGELFLDFVCAGYKHEVIYENVAHFRLHDGSISGSGRLNEAYAQDSRRLFEKAKGRTWMPRDCVFALGMRATKLLRHPRYAYEKVLCQ
jgi:glycosyltransferase involved in cell wall biosynthesis